MNKIVEIVNVEMDGTDGLIVTFTDGTQGGYVVEELLGLRPNREQTKDQQPRGGAIIQQILN
jgi:hypothetical protein